MNEEKIQCFCCHCPLNQPKKKKIDWVKIFTTLSIISLTILVMVAFFTIMLIAQVDIIKDLQEIKSISYLLKRAPFYAETWIWCFLGSLSLGFFSNLCRYLTGGNISIFFLYSFWIGGLLIVSAKALMLFGSDWANFLICVLPFYVLLIVFSWVYRELPRR